MATMCDGCIVPWHEAQQLWMQPFQGLIEFVFAVVQLLAYGSAREPIDGAVSSHLVIKWLEFYSAKGCSRLIIIAVILSR